MTQCAPSIPERQGPPLATGSKTWVLFATILASSMVFIDGSALNVALPALQADLGASGKQLLWIVNAYALLLSALILAGGSMGDIYGRKRVFILGISIFSLASLGGGLAPSAATLIAARALQGIGGALMVPGSLAIIAATVPREERGRAIGTWSAATTVTTIIGPVLGGTLADVGLWRGVFFINIPLGAMALYGLLRHVPETRDEEAGKLDVRGTLVVTLSLAAISYGAIEAPQRGLANPAALATLIAGAVGMLAFVLVEQRSAAPLVPLELFRSKAFSGANLLTLLLYSALFSYLFFFSLTLIQAQDYRANAAGLALIPFSIMLTALSRWAGGLVDRTGAKLPLVIGPLITAGGFFLLGLPGLNSSGSASYWTTYFPGVTTIGIGMGLTVAPLSTAIMTSVPDRQVGTASGINNAVSRAAQVLSIAAVGGFALLSFRQGLVGQAEDLGLPPQAIRDLRLEAADLGAAESPDSVPDGAKAAVERAVREEMLTTFRRISVVATALATMSGAIAALLIPGRTVSRAGETPTPRPRL